MQQVKLHFWILSALLFSVPAGAGYTYRQCLFQALQHEQAVIAHESISQDLYLGTLVKAEPFNKDGNMNAIWKVWLRSPEGNRIRAGILKPQLGPENPFNRVSLEYVAYELNLMLNMDWVPPVAYRASLDLPGQGEVRGSILYFVPDSTALPQVPRMEWHTNPELFASDARVLDILLLNPDRHSKNFMHGLHWVDGRRSPVLIDHGGSLNPMPIAKAHVKDLDQKDALGFGEVTTIRVRTYLALKDLSMNKLVRLKPFVTDTELHGMLWRRDRIVEYFDRLIEERGAEAVLN